MFFKLSTNKDQSFSNHYTFDKFYLSTDAGWSEHEIEDTRIVIKGYVDDRTIDDSLLREIVTDPTPRFRGNFIAVIGKHDSITVSHDVCRASQMLINAQ